MDRSVIVLAVLAVTVAITVGFLLFGGAGTDGPAAPTRDPVLVPQPAPQIETQTLPAFDIVRVDPGGTAVIAGRAAPGAEVVVRANGAEIGRTVADERGQWVIYAENPLPPGTQDITLSMTPPGGEPAISPQRVVVSVPERADQRPLVVLSEPGRATRVLQSPDDAGMALALESVDYDAAGNVVLAGRAPAGATVRVYAGVTPLGDAQAGPDGRWTFRAGREPAPGRYALRIDQVDGAGKVLARVEAPFERAPADIVIREGAVVVQPGNSLWRIAQHLTGEGARYSVIYEANREQIRDPDLIYPGQIFTLPEAQR